MDVTCIFIASCKNFMRIESGLGSITVITYRYLCRLISPPNRPNMDCYRVGRHSPIFAMKAFKKLYNFQCVVMSNYTAKENDQHGCNMHLSQVRWKIIKKIERGLELIYVITYRDLCRLISPSDRPNMDCYIELHAIRQFLQ